MKLLSIHCFSQFIRCFCCLFCFFVLSDARAQGTLRPLTNGLDHLGAIELPGETNLWTFRAILNDTITVSIGEVLGETNTTFQPWIRLRSPEGIIVGNASGEQAASITVTARTTGNYTIIAGDQSKPNGGGATGNYILRLAKTPGAFEIPPGDEGGPLVNGGEHPGRITLADLDLWTFRADNGDNIALSITEVFEGGTNSPFFPYIRLRGPNGAEVGRAGRESVAHVNVTARMTGTYTVVVSDFTPAGDAAGRYLLRLAKSPGAFEVPEGDEGGVLMNGVNQTGAISLGDLDLWSFQAEAGDYLALSIAEDLRGETNTPFVPRIRLRAPDGSELGEAWAEVAGDLSRVAPLTGTYTVIVGEKSDSGDTTGRYLLQLARTAGSIEVPPGDEGGALANGGNHRGKIPPGDMDLWTFEAVEGENITLSVAEASEGANDPRFWPFIRLLSPEGVLLGGHLPHDLTGYLNVTVPASGTYFVIVAADAAQAYNGHSAAEYVLRLAKSSGAFDVFIADEGGSLTNGAGHSGRIALGDLDLWTFQAEQGDRIMMTIGHTSEGPTDAGFVPWAQLFDPQGAYINATGGDLSGYIAMTAPLTGNYTVVVRDRSVEGGGSAVGGYRLHFANIRTSFVVEAGDEGGLLSNPSTNIGFIHPGDLDLWQLQVKAGDNVAVRVRDVRATESFAPALWLYGPDGTLRQSHSGGTETEILFRASIQGIYTLVVAEGQDDNGSGEYEISVSPLRSQDQQLRVERAGTNAIRICWPSQPARYVLQESSTLQAEGWVDVGEAAQSQVSEPALCVSVPVAAGPRFFRLRPERP